MNDDGFLKIVELGTDELIAEALNNGGALATYKESQMLIQMSGVSINAKPRKDGRYQGYVLHDGEKKYLYGRSREEVAGKIKQYIQDGMPKKKKRKTDTSPLFADYTAQWIERYKKPNLKPKSLENLNNMLKRALKTFGNRTMASISADDLQAFFAAMPLSRSRDLTVVYVGQIFKKAYAMGIIKKNPCEQLELKRYEPKKRNALTPEQQAAFLEATQNSVHHLLYRFLLATGLRIGEALALSPSDIKNDTVTVNKDIVFINGKAIIQPPKSKAAFRTVPVPHDICEKLPKSGERIFTANYNSIHLSIQRTAKKLGFQVSPHILRHTYATRLEEAGIPPKIKQYLMGHSSLRMTEDVYTDAQAHYIESLSDRVRGIFDTK